MSDFEAACNEAERLLGAQGTILGSKVTYRDDHPTDLVIFNALVGAGSIGLIWRGDLNVSKRLVALRSLAAKLDSEVWVHLENHANFDRAAANKPQGAGVRISPKGAVLVASSRATMVGEKLVRA